MSSTTKCPLCSESVSWAGLAKHLHSKKHAAELADKVKQLALKFSGYNSLPYFWDGNKQYHLCFGCKLAKQNVESDHLKSCPKASLHRETLKKIADENNLIVGEPETDEKTFKKMQLLETKLKRLEKENEKLADQVAELGDENDQLKAKESEEPVALAIDGDAANKMREALQAVINSVAMRVQDESAVAEISEAIAKCFELLPAA